MIKTVLLTGASGFVGSQCIAPLLARKYKIIAASSRPIKLVQPNKTTPIDEIEWVRLNLKNTMDIEAVIQLTRPSHLLHLAWYVRPPDFWHSNENIDWLHSSLYLLRAFLQAGGQRIVMAGTCAEYELHSTECDELTTACMPNSLYGTAKLALFRMAQKITALSSVSFAWARFFHLYGMGEHQNKLIRSTITKLFANEIAECSNPEVVRDYLHVSDAADAIVALLDTPCEGAVNIGSGMPVRLIEIVRLIGQKMGKNELIRSKQTASNESLFLVPSIKRLLNEVNWRPNMDLGNGIDQMIQWIEYEIHNRY